MILRFPFFSVSVSAKENDGGVHAAMQSLIRYLLEKKYSHKMPKSRNTGKGLFMSSGDAEHYAKTLGSAEDHTFVKLEKTNLKEVIAFNGVLSHSILNNIISYHIIYPIIPYILITSIFHQFCVLA